MSAVLLGFKLSRQLSMEKGDAPVSSSSLATYAHAQRPSEDSLLSAFQYVLLSPADNNCVFIPTGCSKYKYYWSTVNNSEILHSDSTREAAYGFKF